MIDPLLLQALVLAKGVAPTAGNLERIARDTSPEAARWAFSQWSLRLRARAKYAKAESMLFEREALEQATHEAISGYRASRFPTGELAADLTCSIGSDLLALAARGPAIGFDLDEHRLDLAAHNLKVHGLRAELRHADSIESEWSFDFAFADPARRVDGRRSLKIANYQPDPVTIACRMAGLELGAIKLSPMLSDDILEALGPRVEFWSWGGECREAVVWLGSKAQPGSLAVHVESGEELVRADMGCTTFDAASGFLHEADPAAIRAGALPALAYRHNLALLGSSNGYLSGSSPVESVWLKSYRVIADLRGDITATRRELERRGIRASAVKCRAKGVDLPALERAWKTGGAGPVQVAVYPVGKSLRHALVERVEPVQKTP